MNSASQTTARVVQPPLQPPLHAQLEEVSSYCAGLSVRLKTWFASVCLHHMPYGYEDESGFHLGCAPQDRSAH